MAETRIHLEKQDGICTLALARGPANALDISFLEEIDAAIAELDGDNDWQALIITGSDSIFCAGVDLKKLPTLDLVDQDRILHALNDLYTRLYGLDRPVVAAINGHAVAGGMILALCCDYRIAVPGPSRFGLTEVRVGVAFPVSALEIARAELAPHVARNWLMFGATINAETALAQGALDELVASDALMARARQKADDLRSIPPGGYAKVKAQLRKPALDAMRSALTGDGEPELGGWVSEEARTAALKVLSGSG